MLINKVSIFTRLRSDAEPFYFSNLIYSSILTRVYSKTELKITVKRLCRLQEIIITIFEDREYMQGLYNRLLFIKAMSVQ